MKGIFVTGTDTNVGKTVVSAALMRVLRGQENVCYWKPVQTGIETDDDTRTVQKLADCAEEEIFDRGFRLEKPLSPHLSARLANVKITVEKTLAFLPAEERREKFWIVEGAGGALVPLNENDMVVDLIKALDLATVVVARSGLGTINHTLLTVEALRSRGVKIPGVIMNGDQNDENRKAIEHFGRVKVLAQLPKFEILTSENLEVWTKRNSALSRELIK